MKARAMLATTNSLDKARLPFAAEQKRPLPKAVHSFSLHRGGLTAMPDGGDSQTLYLN